MRTGVTLRGCDPGKKCAVEANRVAARFTGCHASDASVARISSTVVCRRSIEIALEFVVFIYLFQASGL